MTRPLPWSLLAPLLLALGCLPPTAPVDDDDDDDVDPDAWREEPLCPDVTPTTPPAELGLDPFYEKWVDAGGLPIIGSAQVPDEAFRVAAYVVANLLRDRPCTRASWIASGMRIGLTAEGEVTTDMPEYRDLNTAFPDVDWNTRARGLGATWVRPLVSGTEENLLRGASDWYPGQSIFIHELAHTLLDFGVMGLPEGPLVRADLEQAYADARAAGLWEDTYAGSNPDEYWAEGVQSWLDANTESDPPDGIYNHVNTRPELIDYDPALAGLIEEQIADTRWAPWCDLDTGPAWQDPTPAEVDPVACAVQWAVLPLDPCDTPPTPGATGSRSDGLLVNRTDQPVRLERVEADGSVGRSIDLPARWQLPWQSDAGSRWRITRDGACLGWWRVEGALPVGVVE